MGASITIVDLLISLMAQGYPEKSLSGISLFCDSPDSVYP
jgi:hypothetical protein